MLRFARNATRLSARASRHRPRGQQQEQRQNPQLNRVSSPCSRPRQTRIKPSSVWCSPKRRRCVRCCCHTQDNRNLPPEERLTVTGCRVQVLNDAASAYVSATEPAKPCTESASSWNVAGVPAVTVSLAAITTQNKMQAGYACGRMEPSAGTCRCFQLGRLQHRRHNGPDCEDPRDYCKGLS